MREKLSRLDHQQKHQHTEGNSETEVAYQAGAGFAKARPPRSFCPFPNLLHYLGQNCRRRFQVVKTLQLLVQPVFVWIAHFVTSFFNTSRPRCISDFTLASDT